MKKLSLYILTTLLIFALLTFPACAPTSDDTFIPTISEPPESTTDLSIAQDYIGKAVLDKGFYNISLYLNGNQNDESELSFFTAEYDLDPSSPFDLTLVIDHIKTTNQVMATYNTTFGGNPHWNQMYAEYQRLYELIESETFTLENFDTSRLRELHDALLAPSSTE